MDALTQVLEVVATRVAEKVIERLSAIESQNVYTGKGPLPPGVTKRRFNEIAREIPEACKTGRTWIIPRAAWEAYATKRPMMRRATVVVQGPWTPEGALYAAGLRQGGER